ncbi:MAG: hypothetical protein Q9207_008193 [Kuettlingeria erythrocarpa]
MADPLSFVSSIAAVSTLAGTVVSKGYRYIKAVKDCPEDVRKLMAEVNVLCGILNRLTILLQSRKRGTAASKDPVFHRSNGLDDGSDQESASDSSSESENTAETPPDELEVPDFIHECRRTLEEIEAILNKFARPGEPSTPGSGKTSRLSFTRLRSLQPKDLKWPLSSSRTMRLIDALERHKSTCTIALAQDGMIGIHAVLKETKLSNKYLAEIRATQQTMQELQLTQENGESTIFITLVVDEIFTRKRSNSVGTAYFYVRHDDKESHEPSNVLGSLISQLAPQNSEALANLMGFYSQHREHGSAAPDDQDLTDQLHKVSQHFTEIYIMIDGLDECGSVFDANRRRLIQVIAGLHGIKERSIRTLVFSRDEKDIKDELTRMRFHAVSIAATSADLRLFANAWLCHLDIRSEQLKIEIVDTLVKEANGMFMWVRAQVDYLQRLPNDREKRKALRMLPPDLPQTYIRIFEVMDSTYPKQTTTYIKRLLKWLVFDDTFSLSTVTNALYVHLTIHTLCEAICIEDDGHWPTIDCIPSPSQLIRWLGCLLQVDANDNIPSLSHFTIKEFLLMNMGLVSSHAAREYLVTPEDERQLVNVCLKYALHSDAGKIVFTSRTAIEQLLSERPFYRYVVLSLSMLLPKFHDRLLERFLCMPPFREFELWKTSYATLESQDEYRNKLNHHMPTPLHFACFFGLNGQVETLLNQGVDPNATGRMNGWEMLPIHLAITCHHNKRSYLTPDALGLWLSGDDLNSEDDSHETVAVQMTRILVHFGADVNAQLRLNLHASGVYFSESEGECVTTPLGLALLLENWTLASLLLDKDADWDATASDARVDNKPGGISDQCSVRKLLDWLPRRENVVRLAAELSGKGELTAMFEEWRHSQDQDSLDNQSADSPQDTDPDRQKEFVNAFSSQNWEEVRELLTTNPDLDVNCVDKNGMSAVHLASGFERDALSFLLERGANPDIVSRDDAWTALTVASWDGFVENMKLLLRLGVNIEHRAAGGCTPLLLAINAGQNDAVQLLLDRGADISATLNDGKGAIHLAIKEYDATVFDSVLARGINCLLPDNYGTTPLHLACEQGLEDAVGRLLALSPAALESVNAESLISGTPLYTSAREGHVSIVKQLLDHGAFIDSVESANLLGSALMVACAEGENEVVQTLLSRGAALEVEGSRFKSAEGTARAFRQDKILKILEEHEKNSNQEGGKGPFEGDIGDLDDQGQACTREAEGYSDSGVDAGQQVELPTMVSVQPASAELPIREQH